MSGTKTVSYAKWHKDNNILGPSIIFKKLIDAIETAYTVHVCPSEDVSLKKSYFGHVHFNCVKNIEWDILVQSLVLPFV